MATIDHTYENEFDNPFALDVETQMRAVDMAQAAVKVAIYHPMTDGERETFPGASKRAWYAEPENGEWAICLEGNRAEVVVLVDGRPVTIIIFLA